VGNDFIWWDSSRYPPGSWFASSYGIPV
jgi:hypothetical protein